MKRPILFYLLLLLISCTSHHKVSSADEIVRLQHNDVKLERPKPGDWLYEHPEPGQTFEEYIRYNNNSLSDKARNKIYLQPVGTFAKTQLDVLQSTAHYLQLFFNRDVVVLPVTDDHMVPDSTRRYQGTIKEQLLTIPILDYLHANMPADGLMIMAITSKDLYPEAPYNFVFGQANARRRVGVSSIYRYSDNQMDSTAYRQCLKRLIKTASHEMCHMLAFKHCTAAACVMNGANSMKEADLRPNRLCSTCLKKLQWVCNLTFDPGLRA
jgi:archaemetzincin